MFWVALHLPALQAGMLEPLAAWACQFTPRVALEPEALLLEVAGSLRYFGGTARRQEALLAALECGLAELGVQASLATASTARAALWRARGGGLPFEELPVSVMGVLTGLVRRPMLPISLASDIIAPLANVHLSDPGRCGPPPRCCLTSACRSCC